MAQGFGEFEKLPGNQPILILEIFMLPTSVILIIVGCVTPARAYRSVRAGTYTFGNSTQHRESSIVSGEYILTFLQGSPSDLREMLKVESDQ